jgi:nitrous oxide reductase accessory protein NosL
MSTTNRTWRPVRRVGLVAVLVLAASVAGWAFDGGSPPVPDPSHKCPVCGMLVHRYPDFLASITYDDGETVFFDGVKDMFKYLFDLARYAPGRQPESIEAMRVTEYYDMGPIDTRQALYVVGSDVFGPMGHVLIPFVSADDAALFSKDHNGQRVLPFDRITPATIGQLD